MMAWKHRPGKARSGFPSGRAPINKVHVVGAGLAGLSAATLLAARGVEVHLYDGAPQAGGRCRSYFDPAMNGVIDNGNHLVLSGNRAVMAYLSRIGARAQLAGPPRAQFAFADIQSGERWTIRINDGPLPFWMGAKSRRVPGTRAGDYLPYARLMWAGPDKSIGQMLPAKGPLWDRLMQPFLLAALNTAPETASAALAGAVLRQTLLKGGAACRPRVATPTLAAAFVDPALAQLNAHKAQVALGQRLRTLVVGARTAAALEFPDATIPISPQDAVILAVPPTIAKDMLPGITAPDDFRAIVNAHFKMPAPATFSNGEPTPPILGIIGGTAEWIFAFDDRISVTVSGADAIVDKDREELARIIWADICKALNISDAMPAWQIVKEKRATFAATPEQDKKRPPAKTQWRNLFLAGDWTRTGLPATIEGALQSGETAAALALRHLRL